MTEATAAAAEARHVAAEEAAQVAAKAAVGEAQKRDERRRLSKAKMTSEDNGAAEAAEAARNQPKEVDEEAGSKDAEKYQNSAEANISENSKTAEGEVCLSTEEKKENEAKTLTHLVPEEQDSVDDHPEAEVHVRSKLVDIQATSTCLENQNLESNISSVDETISHGESILVPGGEANQEGVPENVVVDDIEVPVATREMEEAEKRRRGTSMSGHNPMISATIPKGFLRPPPPPPPSAPLALEHADTAFTIAPSDRRVPDINISLQAFPPHPKVVDSAIKGKYRNEIKTGDSFKDRLAVVTAGNNGSEITIKLPAGPTPNKETSRLTSSIVTKMDHMVLERSAISKGARRPANKIRNKFKIRETGDVSQSDASLQQTNVLARNALPPRPTANKPAQEALTIGLGKAPPEFVPPCSPMTSFTLDVAKQIEMLESNMKDALRKADNGAVELLKYEISQLQLVAKNSSELKEQKNSAISVENYTEAESINSQVAEMQDRFLSTPSATLTSNVASSGNVSAEDSKSLHTSNDAFGLVSTVISVKEGM